MYSVECGAKKPHLLRSTALRNHVGTLSQVLTLKKNELDQLAKFMGHDLQVHREFYRLPSVIIQTAKVAKILLAMEKGDMSKHKRKTLQEISLTNEECKLFSINYLYKKTLSCNYTQANTYTCTYAKYTDTHTKLSYIHI